MADETPQEKEALEKLDAETRDVAWQETQKESDRELSGFSLLGTLVSLGRFRRFRRAKGDPVAEPVDDPDPVDERGLRESLDDDATR